ncbi:hypothetical protein BBK36DRAFT_1185403 [Trichoderma citrinoviride]|uniref:Mid2 domain-containing protein n=1 Tax=Trichoderma citrinoviride TaxID=58853 RepID=A0A2T4AZP7_9HYPO|nr:hypothetical protein BBK36DRAFT_1185403 [Trichoderma citrinoviride]PTB62451.1 hypothetical protein BBK36DRAFT_1185403 [Trichoderma citrinoviride]
MSSLPSVASPTSIETQLPGSTAFLNTSSAATGGPDVSPLPSSSVIFSDSAQDILTSSNDAPNVAPSTMHSPPTQAPSTTGSSFSAEETVGSFSTTAPALPTTITASNQPEPSPQIAPTVTPSSPTPSSATIPSQSSGVGTEIAQEVSSTPANPTSTTRTQATSAAAQPTDDSTQEPEVFSAEAVDPPAKTSALSSNPAASSAEAPPSAEQPPAAPTGAVNQVVSVSAASSSASTTSISATTSTPIPTSISVSTSTSGSAAIFAALSATTDSISSGTSSSTATDATFTFPSAISTLPGDASESIDPVGSSSKPPTGTIVGGTVGGIAAVALILILLWLWKRRAADGRQGLNKDGGFTEKGSFISMGQKLGISTTLNAARRKLGEKLGSRNVNMDRGNSQFLEAAITEPINATLPPDPLCQHPVAPGNRPREFRNGQGISLEPGKLNPFSDANSLMSVTAPPPSSLDPFSDDNMVLPPPVSASTRRSRGRSLGGLGSFQVPRGPPRPHSVHRESVHGLESTGQNRESFLQRRDRIRSDPFDLELQPNQLIPPGTAISTRGSSVYSGQFQQSSRDSYTSRYVSGSSLGDWSGGVKEEPVGYEGMVERVDSPTIA